MTDAEKIDALQSQVDGLQSLVEDLLVFTVSTLNSDRRRHLNQAQSIEDAVEYLSRKRGEIRSAMTSFLGHGSHGNKENHE